jgi:hypothetical protein
LCRREEGSEKKEVETVFFREVWMEVGIGGGVGDGVGMLV